MPGFRYWDRISSTWEAYLRDVPNEAKKTRFVTFRYAKRSQSLTFQFQRKKTKNVTFRYVFKLIVKIPMFQTQRFLRMEPTLASGARPCRTGPTAPGPARGKRSIRITGRSLTQPARFQFHRPSAKRDSRDSISRGVCPAWPVTSSDHFRVCLRAVPPPPLKFEVTTCSLARAQRCLWVAAHYPQAAYEAESAIPLNRPSGTVGARGLRSALIWRIWSHCKYHESLFCFFRGKLKKWRHESCFFLS